MNFQPLFLKSESVFQFWKQLTNQTFRGRFEWREILKQCFAVGNKSFFLVSFTAFLAGIVFTTQSRPSLSSFGAESWLPSLVAQAVVRSLGPLITGLICGIRVEDIEDRLMRELRYMDKLIDELAKGKAMEKILRT